MSRPAVVLTYGMGADSTALLLRWLEDPTSRDFDLADLVVVTAMTGNEWKATGRDVTAHVLPRLRAAGVRFVQCARSGRNVRKDGTGVAVLDDSTAPAVLHVEGEYTLGQEMTDAGTVPQTGGKRLCSVHAKGDVLDHVIAQLTAGAPYRHAVGFEVTETTRITKDAGYNTTTRTGWYPLADWGWDRDACLDYIESVTGVRWKKSACTFCPFALTNRQCRADTIRRMADEEPAAGVATLAMEHTSLALNERQGLVAGDRLVDHVRAAGRTDLLDRFAEHLAGAEHALYEVRRIYRPASVDPTRVGRTDRSVRALAKGTRTDMVEELEYAAWGLDTAGAPDAEVEYGADGIARVYLARRGDTLPAREHFLVVAPATAVDKEDPSFGTWWDNPPAPAQVPAPRGPVQTALPI